MASRSMKVALTGVVASSLFMGLGCDKKIEDMSKDELNQALCKELNNVIAADVSLARAEKAAIDSAASSFAAVKAVTKDAEVADAATKAADSYASEQKLFYAKVATARENSEKSSETLKKVMTELASDKHKSPVDVTDLVSKTCKDEVAANKGTFEKIQTEAKDVNLHGFSKYVAKKVYSQDDFDQMALKAADLATNINSNAVRKTIADAMGKEAAAAKKKAEELKQKAETDAVKASANLKQKGQGQTVLAAEK